MEQNKKKPSGERYPTRLSMVLAFLSGSKRMFAVSIFFAFLVSELDLINPRIIRYAVDSVLNGGAEEPEGLLALAVRLAGGTVKIREELWRIAVLVIVIALLAALCRYLNRLFNSIGAERLTKTIRDQVFTHILNLPFSWHGENMTGDIIQRCTSDVETLKRFLSEQMTSLFRIIILIALAITSMAGIHAWLTVAAAAFIPVIVGYSFFFHSRIGSAFEKVDTQEGRLSSIAQENLTGVRVVRAFGRESYERGRFEKQNEEYTKLWIHLMKILSLFWGTGDLISGLQILTVAVLGAVFCVRGSLTAGGYIAFIAYNGMLTWPVRGLGRVIAELSKAGISIDRIRYICNAAEEEDAPDAVKPPMDGDIEFKHVSYTYENGSRPVLEDVSFTVKAGTTVGILGGTGSGKSTLMCLLDKVYPLKEGEGTITIGGTDIGKIDTAYLRSNIGMVLQEPYLFSGTIAENIGLAAPEKGQAIVEEMSRTACLEETILRFQSGYETYVGERGVTLSGGQKQRTAIAQMLARKTPVMVFDDSLSAVDADTDFRIRKNLQERTEKATVILIAHRITTLMQADEIIVMDKGRIAERGTHAELLEKDGMYRRIYNLQMAMSEVE